MHPNNVQGAVGASDEHNHDPSGAGSHNPECWDGDKETYWTLANDSDMSQQKEISMREIRTATSERNCCSLGHTKSKLKAKKVCTGNATVVCSFYVDLRLDNGQFERSTPTGTMKASGRWWWLGKETTATTAHCNVTTTPSHSDSALIILCNYPRNDLSSRTSLPTVLDDIQHRKHTSKYVPRRCPRRRRRAVCTSRSGGHAVGQKLVDGCLFYPADGALTKVSP